MAMAAHTVVDIDADEATQKLAPVPYVLNFTELSYSVKKGGGLGCLPRNRLASTSREGNVKTLLDGISGEARDGELLAVMGASGSGKSTLLDALAGRIPRDSLRGGATLNGEPLHGRRLRAISAYVMQDDLLYPMLTVRETLLFAAEFRLPRSLPADRKRARVDALVDQLGLARAADTIIGDEGHRGACRSGRTSYTTRFYSFSTSRPPGWTRRARSWWWTCSAASRRAAAWWS
jgi:ABC-type glutathione transport system ATPase component